MEANHREVFARKVIGPAKNFVKINEKNGANNEYSVCQKDHRSC